MLEVGQVLAAPALENGSLQGRSGIEPDPQAVAVGVAGGAEGNHPDVTRLPPGRSEARQEQAAGRQHRRRNRGEVKAGCHRGGVRKQTRLLCGCSPTEGSAPGGQPRRRPTFFDIAAVLAHALIDELVSYCC